MKYQNQFKVTTENVRKAKVETDSKKENDIGHIRKDKTLSQLNAYAQKFMTTFNLTAV